MSLSLLAGFSFSARPAFAEDLAQGLRSAVSEPSAVPEPSSASGVGSDAPASSHLELPKTPGDFSTYDGGWFTMAYHPSLSAKMRVLQDAANPAREELQKLLGGPGQTRPILTKVHILVGRTAGEMETLAPKGTSFPKYASGVAYSELGLVLLTASSRFPGEHMDLPQVFRHELAHVALHDAVGRDRIPRWFNEGFAVHASGEAETERMQALWTASLAGNLLPFERLTRSFPRDATAASIAYAQAADLLRFLLRSGEEHRFAALIRRMSAGQTFQSALSDAYATDMYSLESDWREDVARRYTFWPVIFGGSLIWVGALGLLVWGYFRRKQRAQKKLDRWAREEALEDARRRWAEAIFARIPLRLVETSQAGYSSQSRSSPQSGHLSRPSHEAQPSSSTHSSNSAQSGSAASGGAASAGSAHAPLADVNAARIIPSVEHDGQRYTLH